MGEVPISQDGPHAALSARIVAWIQCNIISCTVGHDFFWDLINLCQRHSDYMWMLNALTAFKCTTMCYVGCAFLASTFGSAERATCARHRAAHWPAETEEPSGEGRGGGGGSRGKSQAYSKCWRGMKRRISSCLSQFISRARQRQNALTSPEPFFISILVGPGSLSLTVKPARRHACMQALDQSRRGPGTLSSNSRCTFWLLEFGPKCKSTVAIQTWTVLQLGIVNPYTPWIYCSCSCLLVL